MYFFSAASLKAAKEAEPPRSSGRKKRKTEFLLSGMVAKPLKFELGGGLTVRSFA